MGHRTLLFVGAPSGTSSSTCLSSTCYDFSPPLTPAPPSWPQPPYALPPADDSPSPNRFPPAVIVVIALLGGIFLLVSYYVIIAKSCLARLRHRRRRRRSRSRDHPPLDEGGGEESVDESRVDHPIWYIRTVGLSPAAISSIAVCVYRKGEGMVEGTDCTVCLSEFSDGETLRILPRCGHAFHVPCIDTWLGSHTNCPLCRAPIVSLPVPFPLLPSERLSQRLDGDDNLAVGAGENSNGAVAGEGVESGESNSDGLSKEIDDVNGQDGQLGLAVVAEEEEEEGIVPVRRSVSMDSPFLVFELRGRSESQSSDANTSESRTIADASADRANTGSHPGPRSLSWSGRLFQPRHSNSSRTSSNSTLPR